MSKKNPLNVVVVQHAEPYVALVLYAAQTFEQTDPPFAKQLEEAARYFDKLMELQRAVSLHLWPKGQPVTGEAKERG